MIAPTKRFAPVASVALPSLQDGFREMRADYDSAGSSRFRRPLRGVNLRGSGADYHYRTEGDFLKLMERARDLDRNDPIVGRMLTLSADATVQQGIGTQSDTGKSKLDDLLDQRLLDWSEDPKACDAQRKMTFGQQQHLAYRSQVGDGDILAVGLTSGQLQHFESHRIRKPRSTRENKNVVHGVRLDDLRAPVEYWVTKEEVALDADVRTKDDVVPFPAYDEDGLQVAYHLYDPKRFSQTRGISALAPLFDVAGMAGDIRFAKLVQAQMVSVWAWFVERTAEYEGADSVSLGERETNTRGDGSTETVENVTPGMIYRGKRGETLKAFSPATPNPEYFVQMREVHQLMMATLGLPYMLVMLDASDTNFSGWRGAYDTAKLGWKRNQLNLIARYVAPIRRWKVQQFLDADPGLARLARTAGVRPFGCKFNRPSYPYINPLQDASTDVMRLANLLTSPQRLFAGNGEDAYDIAAETIEFWGDQVEAAAARAKEINSRLGLTGSEVVSWREILPRPNAQGFNVSLNATPTDSPASNANQPAGPDNTRKPQGTR